MTNKFISHDVPEIVEKNSKIKVTFKFKNTGKTTWDSADQYNLVLSDDSVIHKVPKKVKLPTSVEPKEEIEFKLSFNIPDVSSYRIPSYILEKDGKSFGQNTPSIELKIAEDLSFSSTQLYFIDPQGNKTSPYFIKSRGKCFKQHGFHVRSFNEKGKVLLNLLSSVNNDSPVVSEWLVYHNGEPVSSSKGTTAIINDLELSTIYEIVLSTTDNTGCSQQISQKIIIEPATSLKSALRTLDEEPTDCPREDPPEIPFEYISTRSIKIIVPDLIEDIQYRILEGREVFDIDDYDEWVAFKDNVTTQDDIIIKGLVPGKKYQFRWINVCDEVI